MGLHEVSLDRHTVHGSFWREREPVLEIDPGDTVRFRTLISSWTTDPSGTPFERPDPVNDRGHALVGPISIRGAEPGLMLAVHIKTVQPAGWGQSGAGGGRWGLNDRLGLAESPRVRLDWRLDVEDGVARDQYGHQVALAPFMGVMGMPPDTPGRHSTIPPRRWGGNIDCRELVAGSVLYLPIPVPGGLFSVGDGHAAQGDGEVGGIAIECPMEQVDLAFDVVDNPPIDSAHALTPVGWITFGFHEDLDEAAIAALDAMLNLMVSRYAVPDRAQALALATAAVDLRVTQLVNGVRGVHAVLNPAAAINS